MRVKSKFHLYEVFYNDSMDPEIITYDNRILFSELVQYAPDLNNTVFVSDNVPSRMGIILDGYYAQTENFLILGVACGDVGFNPKIVSHETRATRQMVMDDAEFSSKILNCIFFGMGESTYIYFEGLSETLPPGRIICEFNDVTHKFYVKKVANPKTLNDLFNDEHLLEVEYTYIENDLDGIPEGLSQPEKESVTCNLSRNGKRNKYISGEYLRHKLGGRIPQKVTYSVRDEEGDVASFVLNKSSYYKTYRGEFNDEFGEWERTQLITWLSSLPRENIDDIFI